MNIGHSMGNPANKGPLPDGQDEMASVRDASLYSHPDTHSVKVFHIDDGHGSARCGRAPLSEYDYSDPAKVPEGLRCRRNGCRQRWPASTPPSTTTTTT